MSENVVSSCVELLLPLPVTSMPPHQPPTTIPTTARQHSFRHPAQRAHDSHDMMCSEGGGLTIDPWVLGVARFVTLQLLCIHLLSRFSCNQ